VTVEREIEVVNRLGVHARPAAAIVHAVLKFQCEVHFIHEGARINAKSIMGLLTLAATQGTRLRVVCEGEDADQAMDAVSDLFARGFGED